jgi:hypothetical protein
VAAIASAAGQQFDPRVAHAFASLDHNTLVQDIGSPHRGAQAA